MQQARSRLAKLLHHGAAIGAAYGYGPGLIVAVIGVLFTIPAVTVTGALMFNTAFALQLARLPVQWKACVTAKQHLDRLGLADHEQRAAVVRLMNAAALLDFSHAVWGMRFPRQ
jgi:Zn-dependent membrane protease YugP